MNKLKFKDLKKTKLKNSLTVEIVLNLQNLSTQREGCVNLVRGRKCFVDLSTWEFIATRGEIFEFRRVVSN